MNVSKIYVNTYIDLTYIIYITYVVLFIVAIPSRSVEKNADETQKIVFFTLLSKTQLPPLSCPHMIGITKR